MMFQHSFIRPVKKLRGIVTQAEKEGFKTNVDTAEDVISLELGTLKTNFTKLLTALRFNNPDYHRGDKQLELKNLRDAEAIVNETGNFRGIGVCKNNLGNLVRGMDKLARDRLPAQDRDPRVLLQAAVQNAQELAADPQCWDVTEDNVGSRLLGLAMARMDYGEERKAVDDLQQALTIHKGTGNWQALARLSFVLATRLEASVAQKSAKGGQETTSQAMALELVDNFAEEASVEACSMLKGLAAEGVRLQVGDSTGLAQLCYCMSIFQNDNRYSMWALNSIPNLDAPLVNRLGKQILDEPALGEEVKELVLASQLMAKAAAPKKSKMICFCIDRTWNPILEVCINSIKTIIKDHCDKDDTVCMWGLGTGWVIPDKKKGSDDGESLCRSVQAAYQVTGKCHLYSGMLDTMCHLSKQEDDVNRWLVVLTDLVDLEGQNPKFRNSGVRQAIKGMPAGSTLAVIDTSAISGWKPEDQRWPAFRSNMNDFVDEAVGAGHGGHLLVASDLNALAAKFEEVGELMAEADLGENL